MRIIFFFCLYFFIFGCGNGTSTVDNSLEADEFLISPFNSSEYNVEITENDQYYCLNLTIPEFCPRGAKLREVYFEIKDLLSVEINPGKIIKVHKSLFKKSSVLMKYQYIKNKNIKNRLTFEKSFHYRLFPHSYLPSEIERLEKKVFQKRELFKEEELDVIE